MLDKRDRETIERMIAGRVELWEYLMGEYQKRLDADLSMEPGWELMDKMGSTSERLEYYRGLLERYRASSRAPERAYRPTEG